MNNTVVTPQTHFDEMRATYLGAVPHTVFTAFIWITSGTLGILSTKSTAIIFFLVGGSLIFPAGEIIRKAAGIKNHVSKENRLPQFFTLLAFTIPLSYPLIYFICKDNINLFFPAFTILIGAHYLPFVYGYRMFTFGVLSIILVTIGTYTGITNAFSFSYQAFLTGAILLLFATIHFIQLKREYL